MDWRETEYLRRGSDAQRRAHDTLRSLRLFERLRPYDPALVSTVCVGLDIAGSDLDIICRVPTAAAFGSLVEGAFGEQRAFRWWCRAADAWVARFDTVAYPVEIFAQPYPVETQYAWRHLDVMARLLAVAPGLRERVRARKRAGLGTEPAFAELLGLAGDPCEAVLALEAAGDDELAALCGRVDGDRAGASSPVS